MIRLVVCLLASLCIGAWAADAIGILTPSPLSLVLAYNTYIKDQKKVYYIRVQSQAADFESAKKQAFRLASEQVAGTVVLSESELRNSQLTRDEVITYSSGIVDEYRIVDRVDLPNSVQLTVDIWIVESAMAQRVLARSATERGVDGAAMAVRVDSILEERQRGDAVIRAVLYDYPKRAFQVKLAPPVVTMDIYRNTQIAVNWEIYWDDRYYTAFTEAAKQTGQKPCIWNCPSGPKFFLNHFQFSDPAKLVMTIEHLRKTGATLQIEFYDLNGKVAARNCQPLAILPEDLAGPGPSMVTIHSNSVILGGNQGIKGQAQFNLGKNTGAIAGLDQLKAEVVPRSRCGA